MNENIKIDYCNSKIDKNELKSNFRLVPKNYDTTVHIHRTLPGNDILIDGLATQKGRTQKIKTIGHKQTLEPTDDPT